MKIFKEFIGVLNILHLRMRRRKILIISIRGRLMSKPSTYVPYSNNLQAFSRVVMGFTMFGDIVTDIPTDRQARVQLLGTENVGYRFS